MKIKIHPRYVMKKILEVNSDLLNQDNYLISIYDSCGNRENAPEWCQPIVETTSDKFLGLCFDDVEYKINFTTKPFDKGQAKQIYQFLSKINPEKTDTLYVHCAAGISRSGGVGIFCQEFFGLHYMDFIKENRRILPNSLVVRLLHKVQKQYKLLELRKSRKAKWIS